MKLSSDMAGAETQVGAMRTSGLLDEDELVDIEGRYPKGISSREIVDLFASRGVRFSEATLR